MSKSAVDIIVRRSIASISETMKALGVEGIDASEEELQMMVEVMAPHFTLSEDEFLECEQFLNSELFKKYSDNVKNMGNALMKHAQDLVSKKSLH